MKVKTNAEKEWLRKQTTGRVAEKKEQKAPQRAVVQTEVKKPAPRRSNGFGDVAGMNELKQIAKSMLYILSKNPVPQERHNIVPTWQVPLLTRYHLHK